MRLEFFLSLSHTLILWPCQIITVFKPRDYRTQTTIQKLCIDTSFGLISFNHVREVQVPGATFEAHIANDNML